jgi:hypothetical protein
MTRTDAPNFARTLRALGIAACLPALMGAGTCGLMLDYTETFLVTDPVHTIVIVTDDGNIDATAYERDAILLKRHTFGFEASLEDPHFSIEDGVARYEAHCKYDGNCTFDHMFELPLGVAFDITMDYALIDIGYTDGDIEAKFEEGRFKGVRLRSPNVTITAEDADLDLDFAAVPATVTLRLDRGEVVLEVPAGEYRCALASERGEVTTMDVTCVDTAAAVLDVDVGDGDVLVMGTTS